MKDYAKIILHAYPLLKTVEKDYEEHVQNKAILSYRGRESAERLAEYLATEIIRARNLVWLRTSLERVFARLTEEERALTALRYFRRKGALRRYLEREGQASWSDGKMARKQAKLSKKLEAMLRFEGLTEELYETLFADMELFQKIARYIENENVKKAPDLQMAGAGVS